MPDCKIHPKKTESGELTFQENCLGQESIIFEIFEELNGLDDETTIFFFYVIHEAPRSNHSSLSDEDFVVNLVEDSKQAFELKTNISISEDQEKAVVQIVDSCLASNRDRIAEISGGFVHKAYKEEIELDAMFEAYILTETQNLHPKGDKTDLIYFEPGIIDLIECKLNIKGENTSNKADKQLRRLEKFASKLKGFNRNCDICAVDFSLREQKNSVSCLEYSPDKMFTLYDFLERMI